MKGDIKLVIWVVVATILLIGGAVWGLSFLGSNTEGPDLKEQEVVVRDEGYNAKGTDQPKVTLVEFSDFECPACKATASVLDQLADKYGDNLRFVYQHYPLPQHSYSRLAAQAAESAGTQGKFWEMHDALFASQDSLSKERILEIADQIGLDVDAFKKDISGNNHKEDILRDMAEANRLGITGTPTIYINNVLYTGSRDLDTMSNVIEIEILNTPTLLNDGTNKDVGIDGTGDVDKEASDSATGI